MLNTRLSVGLGGAFANFISWRVAFVSFALLAFCAAALLNKLPQDFSPSANCNFLLEIKRVTLSPKGKVIFPLALGAGFLLLGIYSFLGAFLHEIAGLDYVQVGIVVMFYGFACLLAGSQVGRLGEKIGHQKTIITGGILALFSVLTLTVAPSWQAGWLAAVSLGFGYIFVQSTLATIAFDVASENKGLPSALVGLGLFGGGGLGTAFGSLLLFQGSYQNLWLYLGAGIVILIFITAKLRFK